MSGRRAPSAPCRAQMASKLMKHRGYKKCERYLTLPLPACRDAARRRQATSPKRGPQALATEAPAAAWPGINC